MFWAAASLAARTPERTRLPTLLIWLPRARCHHSRPVMSATAAICSRFWPDRLSNLERGGGVKGLQCAAGRPPRGGRGGGATASCCRGAHNARVCGGGGWVVAGLRLPPATQGTCLPRPPTRPCPIPAPSPLRAHLRTLTARVVRMPTCGARGRGGGNRSEGHQGSRYWCCCWRCRQRCPCRAAMDARVVWCVLVLVGGTLEETNACRPWREAVAPDTDTDDTDRVLPALSLAVRWAA